MSAMKKLIKYILHNVGDIFIYRLLKFYQLTNQSISFKSMTDER